MAATPYSRAEWSECRRRDDTVDDDVEAARRLLVDIDQSFARARCGWSPPSIAMDRRGRWQPGVWENLPPKLLAAAERLRGVALSGPTRSSSSRAVTSSHALIYVDPPYTGPLRLAPDKRYRVDDDGTLWERLVLVLAEIRRAAVILSGYPCEQADRLGWRSVPLRAIRHVGAREERTRNAAPELVWLSPMVPEPVPSLLEPTAPGVREDLER